MEKFYPSEKSYRIKFTGFLVLFLAGFLTFSQAQVRTITGTVTASDTKETLPGATVVLKGSSTGAVTNTGISQITGNVGTNSGSSTGFGNVNGVMHDNDGASAQCAADLLIAYNQLNSTVPNYFPAPSLGNGQLLTSGVYAISSPATLNLDLT